MRQIEQLVYKKIVYEYANAQTNLIHMYITKMQFARITMHMHFTKAKLQHKDNKYVCKR